MDKELIIQSSDEGGIEIALTEDKKLVELHYDNSGGEFNVGDLYLGQVRKVASGLNAVFVNIGHKKDAFLHYTDLSPNFKSLQKFTDHARKYQNFSWDKFKLEEEIQKAGKINDVVSTKQKILVQVLKEPISTKGPRISCEVSLPGRFLVLVPFIEQVNVSKKIDSREERHRLKSIITNIKESHYGVIVRTAAVGRSTAELHQDLTALAEKWKNIQQNLYKAEAPKKILAEQNKTTSLLRDLLNDDFNKIVTNDETVHKQTIEYIQTIAPGRESIVSLHKNGKTVFDHFGINHQVKSSFGKNVMMEGGGYLVIEHTEALHVVDVNSGHKFSADNQEKTALQTNLSAVKELARQLRLRDIGGIIIVDFIDMRQAENRKAVSDAMQKAMKTDRARHSILGISRFGLLQITRQRLRPAIKIKTGEQCPSCDGTGKIRSTHVLVEDLEKHIKYLTRQSKDTIELKVHPIVYSHLTKKPGFFKPSIFQKWKKSYGKFLVESDSNLGFLDYKFFVKETGKKSNSSMLETVLEQFKQTTSLEWFAFSFAILQVVFAYLNKPINFLFGAISVCFYIYLFYHADLIAESILNVYYLIISISGLILWNRKKSPESHITSTDKNNWLITTAIILGCFIAVMGIYFFREKAMDISMTPSHYIDALVSAFAFGGTFLLLKRNIETWLLLNISNLIAIPLQWSKGLYLTALLTCILFVMAVAGYLRWRKELHVNNSTAA